MPPCASACAVRPRRSHETSLSRLFRLRFLFVRPCAARSSAQVTWTRGRGHPTPFLGRAGARQQFRPPTAPHPSCIHPFSLRLSLRENSSRSCEKLSSQKNDRAARPRDGARSPEIARRGPRSRTPAYRARRGGWVGGEGVTVFSVGGIDRSVGTREPDLWSRNGFHFSLRSRTWIARYLDCCHPKLSLPFLPAGVGRCER